jgi:hypothetical protein
MSLRELEPILLRHELRDATRVNVHVKTLEEATGIFFLCPACFAKNAGPIGTHGIIVTFKDRGVPNDLGSHDKDGNPSRWGVSGTSIDDLTLTPSVDVGCWHGHVTAGRIT